MWGGWLVGGGGACYYYYYYYYCYCFFKFLRHDRELMQAPQSEKGRPWGIFVGLSGRDPIES